MNTLATKLPASLDRLLHKGSTVVGVIAEVQITWHQQGRVIYQEDVSFLFERDNAKKMGCSGVCLLLVAL